MYLPISFPPPWVYPPPGPWGISGYSTPPVPNGSLQQDRNPVSLSPASSPAASPAKRCIAPLIAEWLAGLDVHEERGQDQLDYVQYGQALREEGILRLDDLIDLKTPERLQAVISSKWGIANRLLKYAKEDLSSLSGSPSKKSRRSK